ncbi:MAG: MBL fold metallo-hydrolase [Thermoleophilia bacterium]|nr:MBL fold metallo-hydrolase [Thermoleophilia bacterium]
MITIVVENKADAGLATEHGLAMWIETAGRRILFDTGQGAALEPNAHSLGIDLSTADTLVLSHGHYDHTGALPHVLRQAPDVDVYCHPGATRTRYAIRDGKTRSIGIPQEPREALDAVPKERMHWVEKPLLLTDTVGITGFVPRLTSYEDTGGPFYLDPEGTTPDLIEDDMALWIETTEGTVVCLGCAHAGVVNTLEYICGLTGHRRLRAVIGGFHLMSAGRGRLDRTVEALRRLSPALLAPCHCTGDSATAHLRAALGESVAPGKAGTVYRF